MYLCIKMYNKTNSFLTARKIIKLLVLGVSLQWGAKYHKFETLFLFFRACTTND